MKHVLVPVDFSDTSTNAATYATKMLTGIYGINMVLFHMCEKAEHMAAAQQELKKLRSALFDVGVVKTQECCVQGHDVVSSIEKFTRENKIDTIIMGITARNKIEQAVIGSKTLSVISKNLCPVLIVPPRATFTRLKNIALASDFMQAPGPAVSSVIKNMLSGFFAKLHIVNVNPDHNVAITELYGQTKTAMDELFKGYEHAFYFISLYDVTETLNMFVNDHAIDMIIMMPKDHSRLNLIMGKNNTRQMGYQSTVPVLAVHQ